MIQAAEFELPAMTFFKDKLKEIQADKTKINDPDPTTGATVLIYAAGIDHAELVKVLCELGANIAAKDGDGKTALYIAGEYDCKAAVRELLKRSGIDVNITVNGKTAYKAANQQNIKAMLARAGADPNL